MNTSFLAYSMLAMLCLFNVNASIGVDVPSFPGPGVSVDLDKEKVFHRDSLDKIEREFPDLQSTPKLDVHALDWEAFDARIAEIDSSNLRSRYRRVTGNEAKVEYIVNNGDYIVHPEHNKEDSELFRSIFESRREMIRKRRKLTSSGSGSGSGSSSSTPPFNETNTIMLQDFYNNQYIGKLGVGTPTQILTAVFDSGSSDVWFPSSKCNTCVTYRHKNFFNHDKSSTYEKIFHTDMNGNKKQKPFILHYGSGGVEGVLAKDVISFANMTIPHQVAEIMSEAHKIANFRMDGIVGMAFPSLSKTGISAPFATLFYNKYKDIYSEMKNGWSVYMVSSSSSLIHFGFKSD